MTTSLEESVISSLIGNQELSFKVPFKLSEADFYNQTTKNIYRVICSLLEQNKPVNKSTIATTGDELKVNIDEEVLDKVCKDCPSENEGLLFLKQLKVKHIKKEGVSRLIGLSDYIDSTKDPLKNILKRVEDTVFEITSAADFAENTIIRFSDIFDAHLDSLGKNPGEAGLDIGFKHWQEAVGGLSNGRVHMVIATHKTGKSNFGQNAVLTVARHFPVLIVDTEMSHSDIMTRLYSNFIKIPTKILEKGFWSQPEHADYIYYDRIQQGREEFKKINSNVHYLSANGKTIQDMVPAMRRWAIQNKVISSGKFPQGLVIYDYIKLSTGEQLMGGSLKEYQILGLEMGLLHNFAVKYNLPVLTFGQTNREDDNSINCLGASKRLGDNVDSVTLFKEKTPELLIQDPMGGHLLRVFMSRHGPGTGPDEHIQAFYNKSCGTMSEIGIFKYRSNFNPPFSQKRSIAKDKHDASVEELLESQND